MQPREQKKLNKKIKMRAQLVAPLRLNKKGFTLGSFQGLSNSRDLVLVIFLLLISIAVALEVLEELKKQTTEIKGPIDKIMKAIVFFFIGFLLIVLNLYRQPTFAGM